MSNLYSIAVARHKMFPMCKYEGMSGSTPLVLFTSDQVESLFLVILRSKYIYSFIHTFIYNLIVNFFTHSFII